MMGMVDDDLKDLEMLEPEDMADGDFNEPMLVNDDLDDDAIEGGGLEGERAEYIDNFPLSGDDNVGDLASNLGVIDNEDSEVDIRRVPLTSSIDNSPPPDTGLLPEEDDEELVGLDELIAGDDEN